MDEEQKAIARECLDASHKGTMTFPGIVSKLRRAGFEGYVVDFRQNTATYFLNDCTNTVFGIPESATGVSLKFNPAGIQACVREAQTGQPGYTYKGFCDKVRAFGCAGYMVSFPGARVVYFGRTAETHVEIFPGD